MDCITKFTTIDGGEETSYFECLYCLNGYFFNDEEKKCETCINE